jgi:hypothetical protein
MECMLLFACQPSRLLVLDHEACALDDAGIPVCINHMRFHTSNMLGTRALLHAIWHTRGSAPTAAAAAAAHARASSDTVSFKARENVIHNCCRHHTETHQHEVVAESPRQNTTPWHGITIPVLGREPFNGCHILGDCKPAAKSVLPGSTKASCLR